MPSAEELVLVVTDLKACNVPQSGVRAIVLALDLQHLEGLPAKWTQLGNARSHILIKVVPTHHSIEFEHDTILAAPIADSEKLLHIVAIPTADCDIRGLVERITGDGQDVEVAAVPTQPGFLDLTAVAHNGDTVEL